MTRKNFGRPPPEVSLRDGPQRHHVPANFAVAIGGPIRHQFFSLLKQISSAVGGLDCVRDFVPEAHFADVRVVAGRLGGPIPEGRAEAVNCRVWPHFAHDRRHGRFI